MGCFYIVIGTSTFLLGFLFWPLWLVTIACAVAMAAPRRAAR